MKSFIKKLFEAKSLLIFSSCLFLFLIQNPSAFGQKEDCATVLENFEQSKQLFNEGKEDTATNIKALGLAHNAVKYVPYCFSQESQKYDLYMLRSYIFKALGNNKGAKNDSIKALEYQQDYIVLKTSKLSKAGSGISEKKDKVDEYPPITEPPHRKRSTKKEVSKPEPIIVQEPVKAEPESCDFCQQISTEYHKIKPAYKALDELKPSEERTRRFEDLLAQFKTLEYQLQDHHLQNITDPVCRNISAPIYYYVGAINYKLGDCQTAEEYLLLCINKKPDFTEALRGLRVIEAHCKEKEEKTEAEVVVMEEDYKQPEVDLVWIEPRLNANIPHIVSESELPLSVHIKSNYELDLKNINTLVNGQKAKTLGSKSRHRKRTLRLMTKPDSNDPNPIFEYEYNYYPILEEGENNVNVQVSLEENFNQQLRQPLNVFFKPPDLPTNTLKIISIGTASDLQYTQKDALDLTKAFIGQAGDDRLFQKINTKSLIGEEANFKNIHRALADEQETEDNLLIISISAHGYRKNNELYIQCSDFDPHHYKTTAIQYDDIIDIIKEIPTKVLLLLDACHSAAGEKTGLEGKKTPTIIIEKDRGITVFASSHGNESSYEDQEWENGAFTQAIIDGLTKGIADGYGEGNPKDQQITIDELIQYVKDIVPEMVRDVKGGSVEQHPVWLENEVGNTVIFR